MEENKGYLELKDLEAYKVARELSATAWPIYEAMHWQIKKIIGDQWIESADSVGANIAEGYGRFHFLDKIKFYYNARGSLLESRHWVNLLLERKMITPESHKKCIEFNEQILLKINGLIKSQYDRKNNS